MDELLNRRKQVNAQVPRTDFEQDYQIENQSTLYQHKYNAFFERNQDKSQLEDLQFQEEALRTQKAAIAYDTYFQTKTEEIQSNQELGYFKKKKALKKLEETREDVLKEQLDQAAVGNLVYEAEQKEAVARVYVGNMTTARNQRVEGESQALGEMDEVIREQVQANKDLVGVLETGSIFGEAPAQQQERQARNRRLAAACQPDNPPEETDVAVNELVERIKGLDTSFPGDLFQPAAIQRWKAADHALNLLNKMPEAKERLRQRDPEALERLAFVQVRYKMGMLYAEHKTSLAGMMVSEEFLDEKAKTKEYVSKRQELLDMEKTYGCTLAGGTFSEYQNAKRARLAGLPSKSPGLAQTIKTLEEQGKPPLTVDDLTQGLGDNYKAAVKLVLGDADYAYTREHRTVAQHKGLEPHVDAFNQDYQEGLTVKDLLGGLPQPTEGENMLYKLQLKGYTIAGGETLSESIFRSFSAFAKLSSIEKHSPEELAQMIRDLGTGPALGEEPSEEALQAYRQKNIQGIQKLLSISDEHYASIKDKWKGYIDWPLEEKMASIEQFIADTTSVQVEGNLYSTFGHLLPDYGTPAFEERKKTQAYFNMIGMGFVPLMQFRNSPEASKMDEIHEIMQQNMKAHPNYKYSGDLALR